MILNKILIWWISINVTTRSPHFKYNGLQSKAPKWFVILPVVCSRNFLILNNLSTNKTIKTIQNLILWKHRLGFKLPFKFAISYFLSSVKNSINLWGRSKLHFENKTSLRRVLRTFQSELTFGNFLYRCTDG